jgi:uncharacterized protein with PIN domain
MGLVAIGIGGMAPAIAVTSPPPSFASNETRAPAGDGSEGFVLHGVDSGDRSGTSVTRAGDINADGITDLVLGAYGADPHRKAGAGESYVVFGRTTGFPAAFELRDLLPDGGGDGSAGFVLNGVDPSDASGVSVSAAGDVNGDGIEDLMVGAISASPGDRTDAGESYVVFGRTTGFPAAFELGNLFPVAGGDGSAGFVLKGNDAGDRSGNPVSGVGDVNGDGIDDLIVGAGGGDWPQRSDAGESYVVFGRTTGFPASFELGSLFPQAGGDGSEGFVLKGINGYDFSGSAVSGAGDVNGDGVDDFVIGAATAEPPGLPYAGESYVVFGRTTGFPAALELESLFPDQGGDGSAGFVLTGRFFDFSGVSVRHAGDVNGDGIDDLIIGAFDSSPEGREYAGASYVVFGRTTGFPAAFDLRSLYPASGGDGSAGVVLMGVDPEDFAGNSVSGAGDLNGDGIDDIIIGAARADPKGQSDAGESYVVFGRTTGFPASFELASLFPAGGGDGSAGFVLKGISSSDYSGSDVSSAGDVNADGIDDLIIGAIRADPNGQSSAGESYVVFGRTTGFPAVFELSSLPPP